MSIEDGWPTPARSDRKYRRAADSIAQLIVAGRALLDERGLVAGLGRVTLNDAIERSGISRSTAYRLHQGGDGPLESYRVALLTEVIRDFLKSAERFEELEAALLDHKPRVTDPDPQLLADTLREVIRVGIDAQVTAWTKSTPWQVFCSAVIASSSSDGAEAREMLAAGALRLTRGVLPLYRDMARFGGLRLREGTEWEEFARVVGAAVEGVATRHAVDPTLLTIERPTGPDGMLQSWNAASIVAESLFASYLEADPTAPVSADLSTWHR